MKILKEAKIERFGHQDRNKRISTYYQITYIWEYKFLGMSFQKEDKVPILFENEADATDFIECGCNVKIEIVKSLLSGTTLYTFHAYKIDEPNKKHKIFVNGPLDGCESLFVVKGYEQERTWVSSRGGKISNFFEKLKQHEEFIAQQNEKEKKDKEYVNSLYEVKTYKIEKI